MVRSDDPTGPHHQDKHWAEVWIVLNVGWANPFPVALSWSCPLVGRWGLYFCIHRFFWWRLISGPPKIINSREHVYWDDPAFSKWLFFSFFFLNPRRSSSYSCWDGFLPSHSLSIEIFLIETDQWATKHEKSQRACLEISAKLLYWQ